MIDLATLGINVKTVGAVESTKQLNDLSVAGKTASGVAKGIETAFNAAVYKLGAFFSVWKAFDLIRDATMLNSRFETMGVVMRVVGANAGYNTAQMEAFAKSLQKTGISMLESRNTITRMVQAQLDLTKSSELARVAQDAAVIGNINSSEAFQRMVYGIQSGQTEILRTIGINVNFQKSYETLARQLGVTTDSLSEAQKTQARMNAVMEAGTQIAGTYEAAMGTSNKQMLSMARYVEDLKLVLGETFNQAFNSIIFSMAEAFKSAGHEAKELSQDGSLKEWGEDLNDVFIGLADTIGNVIRYMRMAGTIAGERQAKDDLREWTEAQLAAVNEGSPIGAKAKKAEIFRERDRRLKELELLRADEIAFLAQGLDSRRKAYDKDVSAKREAAARGLEIEKTYADRAVIYYNSLISGGVKAGSQTLRNKMTQFYEMNFPGSMPTDKRIPSTPAAGNSSGGSVKRDPYQDLLKEQSDMEFAQMSQLADFANKMEQERQDAERKSLEEREAYHAEFYDNMAAQEAAFSDQEIEEQNRRYQTALTINQQLEEAENKLNLSLLKTDRERVEAQLEMDNNKMVQMILNSELTEEAQAEALNRQQALYEKQLSAIENVTDKNKRLAKDLGMTFKSAFEDAIVGGKKFKDVLASLAQDIERLLARRFITEPLMAGMDSIISSLGANFGSFLASANGNVFDGPGISAYSNKVISRPTLFPFAKGVGLMGEAGEEAVMPLSRDSGGRLGVKAVGGGANVTVNIIGAPSQPKVETKQNADGGLTMDVIFEQVEGFIGRNIQRGQGIAPILQRKYNLNGAGGSVR